MRESKRSREKKRERERKGEKERRGKERERERRGKENGGKKGTIEIRIKKNKRTTLDSKSFDY